MSNLGGPSFDFMMVSTFNYFKIQWFKDEEAWLYLWASTDVLSLWHHSLSNQNLW